MNIQKRYKEVKLKNGAVLRYTKNKLNKISVVEILFNCGSRYDKIPGLAHFTEHMFFSGTKTLNKEQVSKLYFDFIGSNAHTNYKNISFTGKVFTKELEKYFETVGMLITESTFTQENIDKEIKVVQQEIVKYNDNHRARACDYHDYNIYQLDAFKDSILGTAESVATIKSKDVKNFVKKYFIAENAEVYVTSPLSLRKIKKMVENKLISKLPTNPKFKTLPLFIEPKLNKFYKTKHEDIDKNYIFATFQFNKNYYDVEYKQKFSVVTNMINDYSEGLLKEMRLKKSLVYGGQFYVTYSKTSADVTFLTECSKQNIKEVFKTLAEYIQNIKANGFPNELFKKVKRQIDYNEDSKEPRLNKKLSNLYQLKYYGKIYPKKYFRKLVLETTEEEANKMFNEVFVNPNLSVSIYGDANKEDVPTLKELNNMFK